MLYEVAITQAPTVLEAQAGAQEKLVLPFKQVVAQSPNAALLRIGVENAKELAEATAHADQWVVKIRAS